MKCKICQTNNESITYKLHNSRVYKCKNCSFHYSDYLDEVVSSNHDEVHLDDTFRKYIRNQLQNNDERFANHVKVALKHIKGIESPKILDVGIGGGLFLSLMSNSGEANDCYGIELDKRRLKFAKEEYALKNIYSIPMNDEFWLENHKNSFDLITLWDVIEHVNSPMEIFKCAEILLKEGGILIMDTPCRDTFYHRFGELSYRLTNGKFPTFLNIMYSDHAFGHKQILSKNDIASLCALSGHELKYLDVFHELSFPIKVYLKKIFRNETLASLLNPIVSFFLRNFKINNKMLFVAEKQKLQG